MVLGILTSIAACPAIIGTTEAVRQGQKQNEREKHRGMKVNLTARCTRKSSLSKEIDGGLVVLRDRKVWMKLYITTSTTDEEDNTSREQEQTPNDTDNKSPQPPSLSLSTAHPFSGYFMPHPAHTWRWRGEGLVSTIQPDPPILNWIYVDAATHEVKYGTKAESEGHILGPWNVTKVDRRLLFDGWEGFLAVEEREGEGVWGLYFDVGDDGLKGRGAEGKRRLEVEIWRREMRRGVGEKDQRP